MKTCGEQLSRFFWLNNYLVSLLHISEQIVYLEPLVRLVRESSYKLSFGGNYRKNSFLTSDCVTVLYQVNIKGSTKLYISSTIIINKNKAVYIPKL